MSRPIVAKLELRPFDLDSIILHDHRARLLWRAVGTLDLSAFYERIKSRVGTAGGRSADEQRRCQRGTMLSAQ